ncbi:uncharacterized protein FIESC28_01847 [Fusarium coffeatum]|uniref:Uncharacterized protein n=1 Tax=Fusarium coffeatum TaxID=231269 RepID=A0A366S9L3_9HYPO|nr:uncharacterized protein FIESC28_01847 [Fusarium coffeatum]RBR25410.1 hypothetical protein FIESC28_01847 [Fusarium coffeatum]
MKSSDSAAFGPTSEQNLVLPARFSTLQKGLGYKFATQAMAELQIYINITSRYRVFDKTGKLPYSIAFGLCRRSSNDENPRSLRLTAKNSILDVPYALSHGLLSLRENEKEIDTGHLRSSDGNEPYLTLPSPVGRTGNWRNNLSIYYCHTPADSDLGRLFKPGKKYHIQHKSGGDLGGEHDYVDNLGQPSKPSKKEKLISSKAHCGARFTTVESLPWPPEIQTKMQMHKAEDNSPVLEITVINHGNEPITVQTRYTQRFLTPNGPLQQDEEVPSLDPRPRIIDPKAPAPGSTIQVIDMATVQVARETRKPGPCGGAANPQDRRPKLETLTTLHPGQPLVRHVDVSSMLSKLPDGKYALRMEPRGMWWCKGDIEDFAAAGEDRVPHDLFETTIPPLILEFNDVVEVPVENGRAKW